MTRNPNEVHPFGRRRAPSIARAAFVLLWLAVACFLASFFPAESPADPTPVAPADRGPSLQTPEDPEPGGPGDDGGEDGDEGEEDEGEEGEPEPAPVKPAPDVPDSLLKRPPATLPSGAAPMETLGVTKPPVGSARQGVVPPAQPKEKGTIFGLHPAVFFAALIVGHVFVVRAVTD